MDHIQDLSAFQGVILSADNFYSFAKLKSKGGNEEKVKYVLEKLFNFLKEKNYITENGVVKEKYVEYQKLALYIVLNADLSVLEEMTELEGMDAVVWMLPTVPAYLLCELVWGLHMQPFLYQIIAFCNPKLALQVAEAFIANMKYLNPVEQLDRVALVARALYRLACRLHFARAAPPAPPSAVGAAFRACLALLAAPPNEHRVLALPRDDQYKFLAGTLTIMLHLMHDCLAHFTSVQRFRDEGFTDIYLSTHHPESITTETLDFNICDSPDEAILKCLHECNTFLLDDCTTLVMSISLDIFCAWSEYEENGRSTQQTIGELCYRTGSILQNIPGLSDHTLVGMLKQISRRPVEIEDVINDTAVDAIVERVNAGDEESAAWLAALLHRDGLCRRPELLRLLESKLSTLNQEQSSELFDTIAHHLRGDNENDVYLKTLAIKAFKRCSDAAKDRILDDQFKDHLHDEMESADFERALTETFNRLTGAGDAGPGDALAAFLQNPKRTLVRMFRAAAENAQQTDMMLRLAERLRRHCGRYYRRDAAPVLAAAGEAALAAPGALGSAARRDGLVRFLARLLRRGLLPPARLLGQVALPRLHAALPARDARALGVAARLLGLAAAADSGAPPPPRAALLALLAQALDAARAPPEAFSPDAPDTVDLLLDLCDRMFDSEIPARELQWLRAKLQRAAPLTRCHYARLWPAAAAAAPPALADIIRHNCMAVLTLSPREWGALLPRGAGGAGGLRGAHHALLRASRAERARRTPRTWACLLHAHAAFALTVQNNYLTEPPTDEQATAVVAMVAQLAGATGATGAAGAVAGEGAGEQLAGAGEQLAGAGEQLAGAGEQLAGAGEQLAGAGEQLAGAWLPLLAGLARARPELRPALAAPLAHAPLLARPFAAPAAELVT